MNPNKNSSGKVLVIFLVIFVILSLSLAGLAMFFLSKEKERRISTETALQQSVANATKLEAKLQDAIKQGFLLQEKNKEADEKINGLLDELELQEGIREELKKENQALKEKFEKETKAKAELQEKLASNAEAAQRLPELEAQLQTEQGARQELEQKLSAAEERAKTLEEALENIDIGGPSMLRSAAKNFKSVAVVCNPQRYKEILKELDTNSGLLSDAVLMNLAIEVFEHTARYDGIIGDFLNRRLKESGFAGLPKELVLRFQNRI
jgi:DNA repair exonuclease SbcCD ATPase subunit